MAGSSVARIGLTASTLSGAWRYSEMISVVHAEDKCMYARHRRTDTVLVEVDANDTSALVTNRRAAFGSWW